MKVFKQANKKAFKRYKQVFKTHISPLLVAFKEGNDNYIF